MAQQLLTGCRPLRCVCACNSAMLSVAPQALLGVYMQCMRTPSGSLQLHLTR